MESFAGKVSVVTGAASGIGRALAERFAAEGMAVVLADVERAALIETEQALRATGANVLALPTDVARPEEVETLATRAFATFGAVHILCNNAGVIHQPAAVWEIDADEAAWVLNVNVTGVLNVLRAFVPRMLRQEAAAHIVNTASEAGFNVRPLTGLYNASKHAVVALTETLALELEQRGARIAVSALCPGAVSTRILDAARNRPRPATAAAAEREMTQRLRGAVAGGMAPAEVADRVVQAIRAGRFYIFTHPELKDPMRVRFEGVLAERNPSLPAARSV